ncbi:MAG: hypothetical protein M0Z64_03710 [Nitrospiraceae bacterium]|nr:hypothetical protein [Nitrospiraceae bacterium]
MNETAADISSDPVKNALLSLVVEGWRFTRAYLRLVSKLDAGDQNRFASQYRYFQKQLEDKLNTVGFRLVNIEGLPFDPGMAATAINISDFHAEDRLIVDQMLEPIIMSEAGVIKMGTVLLRKVE